jgi:RimJ/RimL family protein N-acetyltransferase
VKRIVPDQPDRVGQWVARQIDPFVRFAVHTAIGLEENGGLIAGVVYEGYNGANIQMHVAAHPGCRWLNRQFLHFAFWYPFVQLDCARVTGLVPDDNAEARVFDEHLGFVLEARLKEAHPTGDLLVYRMFRRDCRWLNLKVSYGIPEQTETASHT